MYCSSSPTAPGSPGMPAAARPACEPAFVLAYATSAPGATIAAVAKNSVTVTLRELTKRNMAEDAADVATFAATLSDGRRAAVTVERGEKRMRSRRARRLLRVGAVAAAVSLLSLPAVSARESAKMIKVTLRDSAITLSLKTTTVGTITFVVRNAGKAKHDFKIAAKKTPRLAPATTAKLVVQFAKAGAYAYESTVPGDSQRGLKGVFNLRAAPANARSVEAGKIVFVDTGCGACHTLRAVGATGTICPNLDKSHATRAKIMARLMNGKGAMPPYAGELSAQQMHDVAEFVLASRASGPA